MTASEKKSTFESVRVVFKILDREFTSTALKVLLLLIVNACLEMLGVAVLPIFAAAIGSPESLMDGKLGDFVVRYFGSEQLSAVDLLVRFGMILAAFYVLKGAFAVFVASVQTNLTRDLVRDLTMRLFRAYMFAPYSYHLQKSSSEIIRNTSAECIQFAEKVLNPMMGALQQALVTLAIVALIVYHAPPMVLVWLLVFFVVTAYLLARLQRQSATLGVVVRNARSVLIREVYEGLGAIREIRVLGRESYFVDRFGRAMAELTATAKYMFMLSMTMTPILESVTVVAIVSLVVILLSNSDAPASAQTQLMLFAIAAIKLRSSSTALAGHIAVFRHNVIAAELIWKDLYELDGSDQSAGRVATTQADPEGYGDKLRRPIAIEAKGLSLVFPGATQPSLNGVSFRFEPGQVVGVVGPTGCGKTSLINLVLGLIRPTEGCICANGIDTASAGAIWQRLVGYVPQDIFLLDATIAENIALGLGRDEIDMQRVALAAQRAELCQFIDSLPEKYNTIVGERGARISGGQRQRIGIARALFNNSEVLILDEGTSALDFETERKVIENIVSDAGIGLTIMIAHRLATLKACDQIILMAAGKIVDRGTFEELESRNPEFRALSVDTQPN